MTPFRLKIDEALTADRVCPQGCGGKPLLHVHGCLSFRKVIPLR
jgi:hypothetical protein